MLLITDYYRGGLWFGAWLAQNAHKHKTAPNKCIYCYIMLLYLEFVHFGCLHSIQFRALGLLPKIWPIDALVLHGMSCRFKLELGGSIEICIDDQGQAEPIKNLKIPLNIGCWARVAGGKCQASYITGLSEK